MFTGIVDHCGKITYVNQREKTMTLWVESQFSDLSLGESIAIEGICLTVAEIKDTSFCCHISPETWDLTTAASFKRGCLVNLERALRLSDRLGGHFVMGHVDQTAVLEEKQVLGEYIRMVFSGFKPEGRLFLVKKGSIAINGVSLTINQVVDKQVEVMLIPHTLVRTNLGQLNPKDKVNIEYDWIAKLIQRQFQAYQEINT